MSPEHRPGVRPWRLSKATRLSTGSPRPIEGRVWGCPRFPPNLRVAGRGTLRQPVYPEDCRWPALGRSPYGSGCCRAQVAFARRDQGALGSTRMAGADVPDLWPHRSDGRGPCRSNGSRNGYSDWISASSPNSFAPTGCGLNWSILVFATAVEEAVFSVLDGYARAYAGLRQEVWQGYVRGYGRRYGRKYGRGYYRGY